MADNIKQYDALALSAGGSLGVMYAGALKVLQDLGVLQKIKVFAGSSVGALVACCLSLGYTAEELLPYFTDLSLSSLRPPEDAMQTIINCWYSLGMYSTDRTAKFLRSRISSKAELESLTFQQLDDIFGTELHVAVCNVTTGNTEYFSKYTTPDAHIIDAVCMSMCVPIVFQPITYKKCLYIDGATFGHYVPHSFPMRSTRTVLTIELVPNTYAARFDRPKIEGIGSFATAVVSGIWRNFVSATRTKTDTITLEYQMDALADTVSKADRVKMIHEGVHSTVEFFKR